MRLLVVDASIIVDLLVRFDPEPLDALLLDRALLLAAPQLLAVEVLQVLRRLERFHPPPDRGNSPLANFRDLPISYYDHAPLLKAIWALRTNLTAYDAAYVALARALGAPLVTRDRKLAGAPMLDIEVVVP